MMNHRHKQWLPGRSRVWLVALWLVGWTWVATPAVSSAAGLPVTSAATEDVAEEPPPPDPEVVALLGRWRSTISIDRIHAAQGMALRGDPEFAALLAVGAQDKIWLVRLAAVKALGQVATQMEVEALAGALKDPFVEIRVEAAKALARRGDVRAWEPLINGLKDREGAVRTAQAEALRRLTGQDFGEDRRAWQRWYRANRDRIASDLRRITGEVRAERERLALVAKEAEEERLREATERTRAMQALPVRSQPAPPDSGGDFPPPPDL